MFKLAFMHLADTLIKSDLQCIEGTHFLFLCMFQTHNRCAASAAEYSQLNLIKTN